MFRKLLFVGAIAGTSASVPLLLQSGPEAVTETAGSDMTGASVEADQQQAAQPRLAAATTAKPRSTALSGRKVVLDADQRGHFVGDFRLNGRRIAAMVDTGATLVAINRSTARSIGLSLRQQDFVQTVDTANGKARAAVAMLQSIEIGRVTVRDVPILVLDDAALSQTLVGMSFLNKLSRFSVEDGALVLVE